MASVLKSRNTVGFDDSIMLEKVGETEFIDNLCKRFEKELIYTYIGEQIVSLNPFKNLPTLYTKENIEGIHTNHIAFSI